MGFGRMNTAFLAFPSLRPPQWEDPSVQASLFSQDPEGPMSMANAMDLARPQGQVVPDVVVHQDIWELTPLFLPRAVVTLVISYWKTWISRETG